MIHYAQIPDISDEAREILDKHLNKMFTSVNSFMIAMTKGLVPEEQLPPMLRCSILVQDPSWAVPVAIRNSGEMDQAIHDLVIKVFDEDKFHEISLDEKYILAKVINVGIQQEERAMLRLSEGGDKRAFAEWVRRYRIENENDRQIVLRELQKIDEETDTANDYLANKGIAFRNKVVKAIGNIELLRYEYPFALTSLFSDMEWEQIVTMQDFEEIIKK